MDVTPSAHTVDPPILMAILSHDIICVPPVRRDTLDAIDMVHPPLLVDPDIVEMNLDDSLFVGEDFSLSPSFRPPSKKSIRLLHADGTSSNTEHADVAASREEVHTSFMDFKAKLDQFFGNAIVPYHPKKSQSRRNYFNIPRTVVTRSQHTLCLISND